MVKKKSELARIQKSQNQIIQELSDKDWLYNPVVYTQISGDFTLMQQRVLIGVIEQLQDRIKLSIDEQHKSGMWPSLFSPEEMLTNIELKIDARSLGIPHERYPDLKKALEALQGIKFGYAKKRGDRIVYAMGVLFHYIEMDVPDETIKRGGVERQRQRSTGKIRIKMDKENVQNFLSMSSGYAIHYAKIAQICKKQRTPRIYILLSFFRDSKAGTKTFAYQDFCNFLGIDDESYIAEKSKTNKDVKGTDNPFHKFSKVKSLILEPSKKELDAFNQAGKVDFSFDYEPIYENNRKKGNPDKIKFIIKKGPLGLQRDQEQYTRNKVRDFIDNMCDRYRQLKQYDLRELMTKLKPEWIDDFISFGYHDVKEMISQSRPDHEDSFVLITLESWIKRREREEQSKNNVGVMELEFDNNDNKQSAFREGEGWELWQQLIDSFDGSKRDNLLLVKYLGLYNGSFCIDATDELWALIDCDEVMTAARKVLKLSRFAPGIIRGKNM